MGIFQSGPLFASCSGNGLADSAVLHRIDAMAQIERRLSGPIRGIHRNNAERISGMDKDSGHRTIGHRAAVNQTAGVPDPAVDRSEIPAAVVIRQPAPWSRPDKGPPYTGVVIPIAETVGERRPPQTH